MQPEHKVCEVNVEKPTIIVTQREAENEQIREICVQWFGEAEEELPEDAQLHFLVLSKVDDVHWFDQPELFQVVFLGQVKDWPAQEKAQLVADKMTKGNLEGWIIWVVSSHYSVKHSNGVGPASFAATIALNADPICGIITPVTFSDMDVLERANQEVASWRSRA